MDSYQNPGLKEWGLLLTNAGPSWHRGLADPERDPGQNHQQNGGNIRLQDEEEHISAQCKMQHQLGVISCKGHNKKNEGKNTDLNNPVVHLCSNSSCHWMNPNMQRKSRELKYVTCFVHSLWHWCVVALHTILCQPQCVQTLHWIISSGPVEHHIL